MSEPGLEWKELAKERSERIAALTNDKEQTVWRFAAGGLTSGLAIALVINPTWPLAFGLFVFACIWMYLRTLQHQTLIAVLLDEDTADLINSAMEQNLEQGKKMEELANKHAALSNRLGSHTGISLSPSEQGRPFTRLPKRP
jgi:hypothetical protein